MVGTPGRLLDLASQRLLSLKNVKVMVLDEADKMLDLGFLPDVEKLFVADRARPATRCCSRRPCRARWWRSPAGS